MTKNQKLIASVTSLICVIVFISYSCFRDIDFNYHKFSELAINAFSILTGFLLTITTLLHTISNPKIDFIRKSNGDGELMKQLRESIYLAFAAIIVTVFFSLFEDSNISMEYTGPIVMFVNLIAFFNCFYFMKLFLKIMTK